MLIGKRVVYFLYVITELFCSVLRLRRATSEYRFAPTGLYISVLIIIIIIHHHHRQIDPNFQVEGIAPSYQPFFLSDN